jgi:pimeloyl-ACP methyl ester carboxylesterase
VAEVGSGPPIVLLHGNPDTHDVWDGVASRLRSEFRCIAPDLPGYGASDEHRDLSLDVVADWVRDLLDGLGIDKVNLVVHDVGGTYGLAFAAKYPDRLSKISILNTNFFPDYKWHFWGRVWRTPVLGELAMATGFRGLFVSELKKASPRIGDAYANHAFDNFGAKTKRAVLRFYRYLDPSVLVGWDQRMLEAISKVPRQVIWGDLDTYIPKAIGDRFGAPVHRLTDSGHWAMVEDPQRVADLLRSH